MSERRTGKTFRRLLMTLIEASKGERVFYETNHPHLVSWYRNHALDIARSYLSEDFILKIKPSEITFKNGGSVSFITANSDKLRGLKDLKVMKDD